jgi:hypothetical protein
MTADRALRCAFGHHVRRHRSILAFGAGRAGRLFRPSPDVRVPTASDTANAVATVIYTHTLKPAKPVVLSVFMNFFNVLPGGVAVAFTLPSRCRPTY